MRCIFSFIALLGFSCAALANVSDRPGAGDSPSVQKNKTWRLETGLISYTKNSQSKSYSISPNFYLIRGLKQSELQVGWSGGFSRSKANSNDWESDWGDLTLRYKYGLGERLCSDCQFAIVAGFVAPRKTDSFFKRSSKQLSIPISYQFNRVMDIAINIGLESLSDQNLDEYMTTQSSTVFGLSIYQNLGLFVQQTYSTNVDNSDESSFQVGGGAFYQVASTLQLDFEINKGLNSIDKSTTSALGFTYWLN